MVFVQCVLPRVVIQVEAKKELTGMDRMNRIKADVSPFLYPVYPVHPCLNILLIESLLDTPLA
jgi:hypothetical protein